MNKGKEDHNTAANGYHSHESIGIRAWSWAKLSSVGYFILSSRIDHTICSIGYPDGAARSDTI